MSPDRFDSVLGRYRGTPARQRMERVAWLVARITADGAAALPRGDWADAELTRRLLGRAQGRHPELWSHSWDAATAAIPPELDVGQVRRAVQDKLLAELLADRLDVGTREALEAPWRRMLG